MAKSTTTKTGQRNGEPAKRTREPRRRRKLFGQHIVSDSLIRRGRLTFVGTRLMVADVLEMVAEGTDWDKIVWQFHDSITKEGIADAVHLARHALARSYGKLMVKSLYA